MADSRMRAHTLLVVVLAGCHPKEPSYFDPKTPGSGPLDCSELLTCYDACVPLAEECMLRCDGRSSYYPVQHARDVTNCTAQAGCSPDDHACRDESCHMQVLACTNPRALPPPSSPPAEGPGAEPMPPQPIRE